jgi:RecJ-like exonuclease
MNGFRKLQERLTEEGWYVGWNLPCCQSCAWMEVPDEADLEKVLFNHSQDCEVEQDYSTCNACLGEGEIEDEDNEWTYCEECEGTGEIVETCHNYLEYDSSVGGFLCHTPEQQSESTFCFNGDKKGVKNLKAILPIIEECDCTIHWNGSGGQRPTIEWNL